MSGLVCMFANLAIYVNEISSVDYLLIFINNLRGLLSAHIVAPTILRNHQWWREEIGKTAKDTPHIRPTSLGGFPLQHAGGQHDHLSRLVVLQGRGPQTHKTYTTHTHRSTCMYAWAHIHTTHSRLPYTTCNGTHQKGSISSCTLDLLQHDTPLTCCILLL